MASLPRERRRVPLAAIEAKLRRSERELVECHRLAKLGTWRWERLTDTLTWSEEVFRMFGRDPALPAPTYRGRLEAYSPNSRAKLEAALTHTIETGEPYELELQAQQPDGTCRWIVSRGEVEAWENGVATHLRGTVQEITERKLAEEKLAISENRYRSLVRATAQIVWAATADGKANAELTEWEMFTGQTVPQSAGFGWIDAVHEEDRADTAQAWKGAIETGTMFEVEQRLRRHDGEYRVMAVRGVPVRDSHGNIAEWVGTHTDITDWKQAEALRRRAEFAGLAELILSGSPAATLVTNGEGIITYVNPAAERLLACGRAEIVGHETPLFMFAPEELASRAAALSAELGETIEAGLQVLTARPLRGLAEESECRLQRADGEPFDAQLTITPLKIPSGDVGGLILVLNDISERKKAAETIYHLAHHDALTGLPTRRLLNQKLDSLLRARAGGGEMLAILMVDLDNFKHVNDVLGHQAGDELIVHAARCLQRALRGSDMVARVGGDEFVVLLEHVPSRQGAERVAQKLGEALRAPLVTCGQALTPVASIGISLFPDSGVTAEALLQNADAAMYRAKAGGGNGYLAFDGALAAQLSRGRQIEMALRHALAREELELLYQPQMTLQTGEVTGVEALLRWHSPELGDMMPADFIPVAEKSGLIVPIGAWVLRTACRQGRQLQAALGRKVTIGVNLSPRQFETADIASVVMRTLAETGLAPESLELEITENLLMKDSAHALRVLGELRAGGVRIAIDDFCTGFCSLSYITRFPIDRLKIDQSFVAAMDSRTGGAVVATIIALARSLNVPAIAEGIETPSQNETLLAAGCRDGQGFYFAQPVPLAALVAQIRETESEFGAVMAVAQ